MASQNTHDVSTAGKRKNRVQYPGSFIQRNADRWQGAEIFLLYLVYRSSAFDSRINDNYILPKKSIFFRV